MSSNVVSSTTFQIWRERSPSSFSLKIQNFSQLEISTPFSEEKYRSNPFSSGGYNWRMIIYPKGNEKDKGNGFIYMYVEIDTPTLIMSKLPTEVFADLRFFVFNKKENKYFAIQYIESKLFNTLRTIWGIPQMLACDTFNDHKNGYIFDGDECEFGVDVIVAPPPTNWEIISFNQKLERPKFSWTIKNFSELKENVYTSSSFSMGSRKWHLKLYPKGDSGADGKWLSIFLCVSESETIKEDEKFFVQAIFRVVDPRGSKHSSRKFNYWYSKSNLGRGYSQFLALADLLKTYLDKDDTLNIEIEFGVVSETKDSLPLSNSLLYYEF